MVATSPLHSGIVLPQFSPGPLLDKIETPIILWFMALCDHVSCMDIRFQSEVIFPLP